MSSILRVSLLLIILGFASSLFAYWPYGGYWGSPYLGSAYVSENIPYFAANPPVYYSRVVPRPYGWSPFPHPFDSAYSPNDSAPQPQVVVNQYLNSENFVPSSSVETRKPLRIINPYVIQSDGEKSAK